MSCEPASHRLLPTRRRGQVLPDQFSGFLIVNTALDPGVFSPQKQVLIELMVLGEPVRFDGSDEMPPEVGIGSFWSEATRAVDGE
ncbi:MAG: hypothetical protein HKO63_05085, partial [Acidimicrobiia bacterium]|nr:hypothetical protein [Acidimicrobiia bacterium]NNL97560.1 hypothetical protein [Acidimicrobiia bacterium]